MMKHTQRIGLVIGVLVLFAASQVLVQDASPANGHNCAGAVVSSLAEPGFGAQVAVLAHLQVVDNLGLADCGSNPRQNP
jgi:hypothetical protein